jgi:hypothetical protein
MAAEVAVPPAYVLTVPGGHAVGAHGAVVTPDHIVLQDVSWPVGTLRASLLGEQDEVPAGDEFWVDSVLPARRVRGTVAVLSGFFGRTYFHWLFDVLPRLGLLQDAGIDLDEVDSFIVPGYFSGFQIETLRSLGIGRGRIISSLKHRHIEADRLLVPSLPRRNGVVPTWVVEYLRRSFPPSEPQGTSFPTRIYITRKLTDHGLLEGEEHLVARLAEHGILPLQMERFTLREKAWLLGRAEAVIGASGAGLTNIVFCKPNTKVVELRVQPIPLLEPWDIANRCKLDFYDVLPVGYGIEELRPPVDQWGLAASGTIEEQAIFSTLSMAGLLDDRSSGLVPS